MKNYPKKIVTIVVTYNATQWIHVCLNSVIESTIPTDIVVIDNASRDNTCEMVEQAFPDVFLIKNKKNLDFGQANNIGLKFALEKEYAYVLLLNQDARIHPEMIKKILNVSSKRPEFGIISPLHFTGKGDKPDYMFYHYITSGCSSYIHDLILKKPISEVYTSGFINAAIWLITHECLKKVGGFDPLFFHTGEDVDYILRVRKKGLFIGICPEAQAYHHREDRKSFPFDNYYTNRKNQLLVHLKNSWSDWQLWKVCWNLLKDSILHLFQWKLKWMLFDLNLIYYFISFRKTIKKNVLAAASDKAFL